MTALIIHYENSNWLYATRQERLRLTPKTLTVFRRDYICGREQPNFPMPAIPTYIDINPDEVVLWQYTTNFLAVWN